MSTPVAPEANAGARARNARFSNDRDARRCRERLMIGESFDVLAAPRGVSPAPTVPWSRRIMEMVSAYLPVLLMGLLALGTWWLVKNTPLPDATARRGAAAPRARLHDAPLHGAALCPRRHAARADRGRRSCATIPTPTRSRSTTCACARSSPDGRMSLWRPRGARSSTATAARCSCSAAHRSCARPPARTPAIEFRGEFLHAFLQHRAGALAPAGDGHAGRRPRCAPTRWSYDNLDRVVQLKGRVRANFMPADGSRVTQGDDRERSSPSAPLVATMTRARLHHRRVERHRPGARCALSTAPAGGSRWSRAAPPRCSAGRRRRASTRPRVAVYAADVRDIDSDHRRRARLHRRARPARRRDRQRRHQRRHRHRRARRPRRDARDLRDQQPRHGGHLPALRARDVRAPLRHAGRHRQRRRHPRPARARRLLREQGGGDQLLRKPARRVPAERREGRDDRAGLHRHAADAAATAMRCRS